ncbi:MAG: transcription termination factor NusA [Dehalococcoidia bacterium]
MIAITQLAAEKNLPQEVVLEAMEAALVSAYKKDAEMVGSLAVRIDRETGEHHVYMQQTVVQEVTDPESEITIQEARKRKPDAQVGDVFREEVHPGAAGRIAAQTAKQVVLQRLREAEREMVFEEFSNRASDIVSGVIQRIEPKHIVVDLGKTEAIFPITEQVRNEHYRGGQRLKFYLLEVHRSMKGPQLILSRTHKNLLKRLFELEVPEIYRGIVEIKSIAREGGYRSKVAVAAKQEGVDPVGSCVGLRGIRIQNIVNELNGERIDVIKWDAEPSKFVANALSPAQVLTVRMDEEGNTASVIVPDRQLSLAIGKEGQNARLAAKLTGWRIDIKPESAMSEEMAAEVAAEHAAEAAVAAATKAKPAPAPVPAAQRTETPEPWTEVVEKREGEATPEAVPVAKSAPATGGLRFAEDLPTPPVQIDEAPKKTKKAKTKQDLDEPANAKKTGKKGRRVAVVDEDEEDYDMDFNLEDFGWKDDEETTEEAAAGEAAESEETA